jgi:hypothetical protein
MLTHKVVIDMWDIVKGIVPKSHWNNVKVSTTINKHTRSCIHKNGKLKSWHRTVAFYKRRSKEIYVCRCWYKTPYDHGVYASNIYFNLMHELGHHVWYNKINIDTADRYAEIVDKKTSVTAYADTDVTEDFAESYAWYYYFVFSKHLQCDKCIKHNGDCLDRKRKQFFQRLKFKSKKELSLCDIKDKLDTWKSD